MIWRVATLKEKRDGRLEVLRSNIYVDISRTTQEWLRIGSGGCLSFQHDIANASSIEGFGKFHYFCIEVATHLLQHGPSTKPLHQLEALLGSYVDFRQSIEQTIHSLATCLTNDRRKIHNFGRFLLCVEHTTQ